MVSTNKNSQNTEFGTCANPYALVYSSVYSLLQLLLLFFGIPLRNLERQFMFFLDYVDTYNKRRHNIINSYSNYIHSRVPKVTTFLFGSLEDKFNKI
jgi:hypothetical protein